MADNRLFIGDLNTRKFVCISKGYGRNWGRLEEDDTEDINILLRSNDAWDKTSLVFFTENDRDFFDYFHGKGTLVNQGHEIIFDNSATTGEPI